MNYIKTFEGFFSNLFRKKEDTKRENTEILYSEISKQEFAKTLDNHENDNMTSSENSFLRKYNKYRNMDIYKLTDEWFLVMIWVKGLPIYFKCDTFEGLKQLLVENSEILKTNILGN
jgi:hypothetical protein